MLQCFIARPPRQSFPLTNSLSLSSLFFSLISLPHPPTYSLPTTYYYSNTIHVVREGSRVILEAETPLLLFVFPESKRNFESTPSVGSGYLHRYGFVSQKKSKKKSFQADSLSAFMKLQPLNLYLFRVGFPQYIDSLDISLQKLHTLHVGEFIPILSEINNNIFLR